jgi:succinate dehydrogenase / fumarate reductase flavoprotein subunit/L-aspartate oxidase
VVSVRDQIGPALIKLLRARVQSCDLEIRQHTQVLAITPRDGGFILRLRRQDGGEEELRTACVVCCTGGVTWREAQRRKHPTTNPVNENHLLFDQLSSLGLRQVHADFFQFQPFGIVDTAGSDLGRCVPESIVNFGVQILDREQRPIGDIRQDRYALTQCMFEMAKAGRAVDTEHGPGLWLTLSAVPEPTLASVFPKVHQYLERHGGFGQDLLIYPFLHYHLGGLRIDPHCQSDIPGLFLAGEITGGLHGRNRLMGNGITDSLVHGRLAGLAAAQYVRGTL